MKKLISTFATMAAVRRLAASGFVATMIFGSGAALAALPPPSGGGTLPISNAAVRQLVSDAQKALQAGNSRLALILMRNAVSAAPRDGVVRAELGLVLLRTGDALSAEREIRQARADGAPDALTLRGLYQAMLVNEEYQKLLDEFPEPPASAQGVAAADTLKARALALQPLGHPVEAMKLIDRAIALNRDVPSLLTKARLAEQQNDLVLAKNLDDQALAMEPKSTDALMFRLGLLTLTNDNVAALKLSDQILALAPNNLPARIAKIETYLKLRQDSKAKIEVDAILTKAPGIAIGLYYKALLLARANDFKGAWNIAQSLPPEFTQSQAAIAIMMAQMAISSGNVETGSAILSAALARSPDLVELRLRLAAVRLRQNSPDAALAVLQLIKNPSDPRVLAMLSQTYLKLGRYSDALDVLDKLNATGSAGQGVKRQRALVELQAGQSEQALRDLIELGASQPTDASVVAPLVAALVQAKRFPEALAAADRLGTDPKQKAQAYFFRGQIRVVQGDANGAFAEFQKSLQIDPKNVTSLYYRANLYEGQRKYAEAARDFQAILAIDPKNISVLVKLAEVAARQGQDQIVRTTLAKAAGIAPQNSAPRLALIRYLIARKDMKAALSAADELVRLMPKDTDGLTLFGELQLALGQKTQAITTFHRLAGLVPRAANPQLLLAGALFANGDHRGAAGALSAAASVEPNNIDVRSAQVNLAIADQDFPGAVTIAKAYQISNPGTLGDLLVADTYIRTKQYDQATAVLNKSLAAKPDKRVVSRLAQLAVVANDRKKAQRLLSDWLNTNPRDSDLRSQYAAILLQGGDDATARAQYEIVLKANPNDVASLNNLGWLLQKDDPRRATQLLTQALKLSPDAPDVIDTLGWIKLQQKDAKGALELLNRAHSLRKTDGAITYHLVLALDANGNHNSAKGLLRSLLDSGVKFDDLDKAKQLAASWR